FQAFVGVDITRGLVKIPGVLADAGVAAMLFLYARRFLDGKFGTWSGERLGLLAAAVYMLNPGTIFNSAVWGQIDSVGTLAVLVALYWLARGWTELAAIGAVVAFLIKFQYAFVIPIVLIVGLKRHAFGRSSDPALDGKPDLLRVLTSLAAGLGSLVALIYPFRLVLFAQGDAVHGLYQKFEEASRTYAGLTINAINLWRNAWSGIGSGLAWGCDAPNVDCTNGAGIAFTIGSSVVTWQTVGFVLFGIVVLIALWQLIRRDDAEGLLLGALLVAVAFFVLPTRVHERYLFPAVALAAPLLLRRWPLGSVGVGIATFASALLAFVLYIVPTATNGSDGGLGRILTMLVAAVPILVVTWGGAALYGLLSLSLFANVYWVYTSDWSYVPGPVINPGVNGLPMARDPFLNATLFSDAGIFFVAGLIVVVLGMLAWLSIAYARGRIPATQAATAGPMRPTPTPQGASTTATAGPAIEEEDWREGFDAPWYRRFVDWLRPDRSDPYLRERGRRLDKLDLAIMAALVLFALVFRLWRLDTPRSMHFDEVYHARSATEWLTDWQEGWTRDTYEWTHPMLAKYLIAAGIVAADPNKIIGQQQVDQPQVALAVASQRADDGIAESIVFGAAGDTITARTVLGGDVVASWHAPAEIASL
ncbi:MAG TPA: hypothetical protein VHU77_08480, partial [Candidatus Limnocylindria bacterium]|nr:hypothetical protein [Candidatus Limnocylindria bacterium]